MEKLIKEAIESGLSPTHLEIIDESALQAGHAGAQPGGETHYRILVVSDHFSNLSRVARQQSVYAQLDAAFARGLHALAMRTLTPAEYAAEA